MNTTDTATVKPTFHYHHTSVRRDETWFQRYVNEYTLKDRLKRITIPYRSAIKQGYVRNGVMFDCAQNFSDTRNGKRLWQHEADAIVNYVTSERQNGRDVVAVTHGMSHPLPDTVCTYIYERTNH